MSTFDIPNWFTKDTPPPQGLMNKAVIVYANAEEVVVRADIWRDGENLRRGAYIQRRKDGGWSLLDPDIKAGEPSTSKFRRRS